MGKIQYLSICFVIKFLNLQRELFFFFHCHLQEKTQNPRLTKKIEKRKVALYLHVELAGCSLHFQNYMNGFIQMYKMWWGMSQREQELEL